MTKTPRTYFDEASAPGEEYAMLSSDEERDVMDASMDERLIPRAEHARTSASKRTVNEEISSPLLTSRSAPRTDLKHRKDSLMRMAKEQAPKDVGYTGRSRLESKKMKVAPKEGS